MTTKTKLIDELYQLMKTEDLKGFQQKPPIKCYRLLKFAISHRPAFIPLCVFPGMKLLFYHIRKMVERDHSILLWMNAKLDDEDKDYFVDCLIERMKLTPQVDMIELLFNERVQRPSYYKLYLKDDYFLRRALAIYSPPPEILLEKVPSIKDLHLILEVPLNRRQEYVRPSLYLLLTTYGLDAEIILCFCTYFEYTVDEWHEVMKQKYHLYQKLFIRFYLNIAFTVEDQRAMLQNLFDHAIQFKNTETDTMFVAILTKFSIDDSAFKDDGIQSSPLCSYIRRRRDKKKMLLIYKMCNLGADRYLVKEIFLMGGSAPQTPRL